MQGRIATPETPEMQQNMTAYFVGRATGKTMTLIRCAQKNKTAILCLSNVSRMHVLHTAEQMGVSVEVYTSEEFSKLTTGIDSADNKK